LLVAQNDPDDLVRHIASIAAAAGTGVALLEGGIADDTLNLAVFEERPLALEAVAKGLVDVVFATAGLDNLTTRRDELAADVFVLDVLADKDVDRLEGALGDVCGLLLALALEEACARAETLVGVAKRDNDLLVGGILPGTRASDDSGGGSSEHKENSRRTHRGWNLLEGDWDIAMKMRDGR
jgi:hypothetical protein